MENRRRKRRPAKISRDPKRKRLPVSGRVAKKLMSMSTLGQKQVSVQRALLLKSFIYNNLHMSSRRQLVTNWQKNGNRGQYFSGHKIAHSPTLGGAHPSSLPFKDFSL